MAQALQIQVTRRADGAFVCRAGGLVFVAPPAGGLETDDGRPMLAASEYVAHDAAAARWLVRRALEA